MRKRWMSQEHSERGRSPRAPSEAPIGTAGALADCAEAPIGTAGALADCAEAPIGTAGALADCAEAAGGAVAAAGGAWWLWLSGMPSGAAAGPGAARSGRRA